MLVLTDGNKVSRTDTSNTLIFDNVKNQMPDSNRSYVLEVTSQVTGSSDSCRLVSTKINDRLMEAILVLKGQATPVDKTAGELFLGTTSLPFGFYNYQLGFQVASSTNTSITHTTVIQQGIALLIDVRGSMQELDSAFVSYSDDNTYHAYEN
tara:strand:- start:280 stop:735 length:456 start_codon:yes stop_codon:yes gene_type:complete